MATEIAETLDKMLRGLNVKRLHTEPVEPQTVGQHSANMCATIVAIYSPAMPPAELLVACVTHDLPEEEFGDIPAPAKWRNKNLANEFSLLETIWYEETGIPNPNFILTPEQTNLLKMVDSLELFWYCLTQGQMGNSFVQPIVENLVAHIQTLKGLPYDSQIKDNLWELLP